MRTTGFSLAFLLALTTVVLAANTPAPQSAAPPEPSTHKAQPLYKSIWHADEKGMIVHLQSGLACGASMGEFWRQNVTAYKPSGLDVSCNYIDRQKSLITIYMTRRENDSLADDFAEAEHEMLQAYPDASPLPAQVQTGGMQRALYAREGGQTREGIWIGDLTGWTLEYRATWVPGDESSTLAEIEKLTAAAQASAGTQLGVCAKLPAPVRDGALVTDKKDIETTLMSQTIVDAAAESAVADKNATPEVQPIWCAEAVLGEGDDAMLLWRAVNADGTDAEIDRIAPFTLDEPDIVTSSVGSTLDKILGELNKGKNGKQRWTVTFANDSGNWTLAFYDGRPDGAALLKLGNDIRYHRAKALGGYSVKDKKITITVPDKQ